MPVLGRGGSSPPSDTGIREISRNDLSIAGDAARRAARRRPACGRTVTFPGLPAHAGPVGPTAGDLGRPKRLLDDPPGTSAVSFGPGRALTPASRAVPRCSPRPVAAGDGEGLPLAFPETPCAGVPIDVAVLGGLGALHEPLACCDHTVAAGRRFLAESADGLTDGCLPASWGSDQQSAGGVGLARSAELHAARVVVWSRPAPRSAGDGHG